MIRARKKVTVIEHTGDRMPTAHSNVNRNDKFIVL